MPHRAQPRQGNAVRLVAEPYTGCVHRCTFCYVRAFERRADRPSDDRYGRTIRVKPNIADVLRRELARRSWVREEVTIGAATDPYQPAEGRYRLTRACIVELARARTPTSIITRGPLVWRDVDVLQEACDPSRGVGQRLGADARRSRLADDGAGHGTAPPPARDRPPARRRRHPHERRRRADPARASRTGPSSSPRRSRRRGRPERTTSGRACSTCVPERASTSSRRSPATGPRKRARYEKLYEGRSYLPRGETAPVTGYVACSRASTRATAARATARARPDAAHPRLTPPVESPRGRNPRDHRPARRRPRGRARGPAPRAPPLGRTSASSARPPTARRRSPSPSAAGPT